MVESIAIRGDNVNKFVALVADIVVGRRSGGDDLDGKRFRSHLIGMVTNGPVTDSQILALGRAGHSRAEIVSQLGITLAEAAQREADDPAFAAAMELAEEAARAWWAGLQREAMSAGARWGQGAWRDAVRWRFGEGLGAEASAPEAPGSEESERQEAIFEIPDNGTRREFDAYGRQLNGTAVHSKMLDMRNADMDIRICTRELKEAREALDEATRALEAAHAHKAKVEAREVPDPFADDFDDDEEFDDDHDPDADDDADDFE
ncbi:MAG TPA: hypothetical protein VGL58_18990 [Caulobacteraceae bacterium]|jgi:hypothetical protein